MLILFVIASIVQRNRAKVVFSSIAQHVVVFNHSKILLSHTTNKKKRRSKYMSMVYDNGPVKDGMFRSIWPRLTQLADLSPHKIFLTVA